MIQHDLLFVKHYFLNFLLFSSVIQKILDCAGKPQETDQISGAVRSNNGNEEIEKKQDCTQNGECQFAVHGVSSFGKVFP